MAGLMVYTEETYYFEEKIKVIVRQGVLQEREANMSFYNKDGFWFAMNVKDSIYELDGVTSLIAVKLKQHGHSPKFKYSCKHINYSCSEKQILDTVDFYITESNEPQVLSVMEQINHSPHLKAWNVNLHFSDFAGIRQFTDSIFYGMFTIPA